MLCPLLSRHEVDPATGKGEWTHLECLGAQCKFYNVPEADCQFLLSARNGAVALPAVTPGDMSRAAAAMAEEPAQVERRLAEEVTRAVEERLERVQGPLADARERLDRLHASLDSLAGLRETVERLAQTAESARSGRELGQIRDLLGELGGRQAEATERLQRLETQAARAAEIAARQEEQRQSGERSRLDADERLRALENGQQEALRALQAFQEAVTALPSRHETLAERVQNSLEEALRSHAETVGSRVAEELKAHASEQSRQIDALNENGVRNHGRLLQALKKGDQAQDTLSESLRQVREAVDRGPSALETVGKQIHDLQKFTHDALDAARQRAEGLWSQVDTVGRSLGQLALVLKSLQGEIERVNTGVSAIRTENKSLLLAFHEQKVATQQEHQRSQAEQARELNNRGVALFHRGSLEAAIEAFIRAVELKPDYAEAYNNLGLAYSKRGQSEESVRYFQKALEIDPQMGEVYNNLGFLFHSSGRYERAVEMFTRSLQTGAEQSIAYTNLGNTFYKMKQHDKAVAAWKKALEIDPLNDSARRGLAMFQQEPPAPVGASS